MVSIVRAQQADIAAVAAYPSIYIGQQLQPFAFIYIPLGLICACGLAWAVAHISRIRLSLPAALRSAAKRREFYVEYQPIINLETLRFVGAEALVRWRRSGRVVRPNEFIPAAEESGVITLITACVAEIVAADLPHLMAIDPDFHIAINLSGPDFLSTDTVNLLKDVLATSHARPCNLHVEATERCFLQADHSRWMIALIRSLGIAVSIDDFGTGYSSLSCLETLGLDALKIDKSFVETIGTDAATSQVVPHICAAAASTSPRAGSSESPWTLPRFARPSTRSKRSKARKFWSELSSHTLRISISAFEHSAVWPPPRSVHGARQFAARVERHRGNLLHQYGVPVNSRAIA